MTRTASITVGLALLLIGAPAGADPSSTGSELLERAHAAHHDLDYGKARKLLESSLRTGDHDQASLAELYALSGRIAAAYDQPEQAYEHFRRMVLLSADSSVRLLPKGLAPKIVGPFKRARADLQDTKGIAIRVARSTSNRLTIAVSSDPLSMVAGAEAVFRRAGEQRRVYAKLRGGLAEIKIPAGSRSRARVHAIDRFGNRLADMTWRRSSSDVARKPASAKRRRADRAPAREERLSAGALDEAPPKKRKRSLATTWQVWGTAAVGAGAAALYSGFRARENWAHGVIERSASYSFEEAQRLQRNGERYQLYSNIGTAAALGLAGVSLYLRLRGNGDEQSGLGATISTDGASVSLRRSF